MSNTAGSRPDSERYENEARDLEARLADLRIPVFRVKGSADGKSGKGWRRKPFCAPDVLDWLRERGVVRSPDEVVVVGDRLGTDTLMAAQMGAWSVWCKDGVRHAPGQDDGQANMDYRGFLAKVETVLERYLRENRGVRPRAPKGWDV